MEKMFLQEKEELSNKKAYKKEKRRISRERTRQTLIKHLELTIGKYEAQVRTIEIKVKDAKQRGSIGDLRIFNAELKSKKVFIAICKGKLYLLKKSGGLNKSEEERQEDAEAKQNKTVIDQVDETEDDL
jgi:hypothetical protein